MDDLISREECLKNLCYFCPKKCKAEEQKDKQGYGVRCAQWFALDSMPSAELPPKGETK